MKTTQETLMELTKEVKKKVELNALEVALITQILTTYKVKIEAAFKLKRHRADKDFIETRQLTNSLVDKFADIHEQNKKEYEKLTELKNCGKN